MDENKLLTLSNGERIRLQDHAALLFEVADLKYASPSTVSRCGMIYFDAHHLGPHPIWTRWLNLRCVDLIDQKEYLEDLYHRYIHDLIDRTSVNSIVQLTKLLDALLLPSIDAIEKNVMIHKSFIQCLMWTLGSSLTENDRLVFDQSIRSHSGLSSKDLPEQNAFIFDYFYDIDTDQWTSWEQLLPLYEHDRTKPFPELFVPTIETIRFEWLMKSMVKIHQPVLFVGETGSSKTATIRSFLRQHHRNERQLLIHLSSKTNSFDVQRSIESQIEKRSKDHFGPPVGKRLMIFLDDLSMPEIDSYGTQQPIALLKLLIEKGGMFSRNGAFHWKNLVDTDWIGAMTTHQIDPRFLSHFSVFYISSPSATSLFRICSTILQHHVTNFSDEIRQSIPSLIQSTLDIYNDVHRTFRRTPAKCHYVFSLRDLSRILQGLLRTTPDRFNTIERFLRVWFNECSRVFADRFIDSNDRMEFEKIFSTNSQWKNFDSFIFRQPIVFGDFRTSLHNISSEIYEDLQDYSTIKSLFDEFLIGNHLSNEFILFDDAIEHLTRICRVLRLDRGHLLLMGAAASGKQTICRLAALATGCQMFEIDLNRNHDELKRLLIDVGQKNLRTMVFLTETEMFDERFFDYFNQLLCTGFIPILFNDEVQNDENIIG